MVFGSSLIFLLSFAFSPADAQSPPSRSVHLGLAANFSDPANKDEGPNLLFVRKAADLALSEFLPQLKEKGIDVSFEEFDYQNDKVKTLESARRIAQSDILAVVGYSNSSDVLLAGPILQRAGIPLISTSATAERVDKIGRFVRRVCFDDSFQGRAMANFSYSDLKLRRVAIVSASDCAYCQSLRTSFQEQFIKNGGSIVADETILSDDTDFTKIALTLKSKGKIDGIFVPNYERTAAALVPDLIDAGIDPKYWIAGDGWGSTLSLFHREIGSRKYVAYGIAHWNPDTDRAQSKAFRKAFKAKFGNLEPNDTAVLTYDAVSIVLRALLSIKSIDRESLMTAIESERHIDGASGTIDYSRNDRTPSKSAVIVKMQNLKLSVEKLVSENRGTK